MNKGSGLFVGEASALTEHTAGRSLAQKHGDFFSEITMMTEIIIQSIKHTPAIL